MGKLQYFSPRSCGSCHRRSAYLLEGMTLEEYWDCTLLALSHEDGKGPQLIVDDGGDATLLIHKGHSLESGSTWVDSPSANSEEQCIKDLLKRVNAENPRFWSEVAASCRGSPKKRQPEFSG